MFDFFALFIIRNTSKFTAFIYRVYSPDRQFLGLGEIEKDGEFLKVRRVYVRE